MSELTRFDLEGVPVPVGAGADVLQMLAAHVSVRNFTAEPIPDDLFHGILVAARSGSTSSNLQTYSIINVTDPAKRQAFFDITGGQAQIKECAAFLVFCPDLYRLRMVCERQGYEFKDRKMEMFLQAVVDATIAGQNAAIAAEAAGLGIVYIGSVRNDVKAAAKVLDLPQGVFALFGMCLGYPAQRNPVKPRLPQSVTVFTNSYSTDSLAVALANYDATMAASGIYTGRQVAVGAEGTPQSEASNEFYGWCEHTARRLARANPSRSQMMQILEELGFEF